MSEAFRVLYTPDIKQTHIDIAKSRWSGNAHWYKQRTEPCFKELVHYIEQVLIAFENLKGRCASVDELYLTMRSLDDQLNRRINEVNVNFLKNKQ